MRVTVLIPAYNSQRTILRALRAILAQMVDPLKIIVVDDGSSDSTASVVKDFSCELKPGFLKLDR